MSDLVERLRRGIYCAERRRYEDDAMCDEAADRIEHLEAAMRPLACTCKAKHQADCSRSEVDCPFWHARATLGEERT